MEILWSFAPPGFKSQSRRRVNVYNPRFYPFIALRIWGDNIHKRVCGFILTPSEVKQMEEEFKHIVRIARKDLDGNKTIEHALTDIKGVGKAFAKAIVSVLGFDGQKRIGYLSEEELTRLEEALKNPEEYDIPHWMMNRRQDYETGEDKHLIEADLEMSLREDLNRLKKIRSYRGIRHELGLPVRGQRTRSTFRKGQSVGVRRRRRK